MALSDITEALHRIRVKRHPNYLPKTRGGENGLSFETHRCDVINSKRGVFFCFFHKSGPNRAFN
jgi:hypothetical protein